MDTEGKGKGGLNGESSTDMHASPRVGQRTSGKLLHGTGSSVWCSVTTREVGRGWEGGSRERDACIHMADSCCCTAETNTIL